MNAVNSLFRQLTGMPSVTAVRLALGGSPSFSSAHTQSPGSLSRRLKSPSTMNGLGPSAAVSIHSSRYGSWAYGVSHAEPVELLVKQPLLRCTLIRLTVWLPTVTSIRAP